jgi:hypothetical protein
MCCLLAAFMLIGARGFGIIWWILEPVRWQATFNGSFILPLLGVLFLPWTTVTYVAIYVGGVTGLEWLLLGLALFLDLASYGSGYFSNARRGGSTAY